MKPLRFALFGHPVRHSVSPAIHEAAFRALGLPHGYVAIDVPSDGSLARLVSEIRRGSFAGANVTLPHKRRALELADEVAPSAEEARGANVLARAASGRVVAHSTDALALATDLGKTRAFGPASRAVVIGAGGGGLAAIAALARLGIKAIGVTTPSFVSTERMLESPAGEAAKALGALTFLWPEESEAPSGEAARVARFHWPVFAASADVVVQATSAGMQGGPPGEPVAAIVPFSELPAGAVAYDLVYRPAVTPFLQAAAARGLPAISGLGMLVEQAALSFEIWTGEAAPRGVMLEAAARALGGGAGPAGAS